MKSEKVDELLLEVSKNKPAEQSSHCEYSIGKTSSEDAGRAISEFLSDDYAFHTGQDQNAWWYVDLLEIFLIQRIEIINRALNDFKFRNFRVESSDDCVTWTLQLSKVDNEAVSSDLQSPARFEFERPFPARFVRIVQIGLNNMHLRRIRIFGSPIFPPRIFYAPNEGDMPGQATSPSSEKNRLIGAESNVSFLQKDAFSKLMKHAVRLENSLIVKMTTSNLRDINYIALDPGKELLNRNKISIKYLDNLLKNYGDLSILGNEHRDLSFVFQGDDRPVDESSVSWQTKTYYKNVCVVPDFYYANNYGYSSFLPDSVISWESRAVKVFWRGATTGGFDITVESLLKLPRFQLCELGSRMGELADFGIYQVVQAASDRSKQEIESFLRMRGMFKKRIPLEEFSNYRYFVQIDGNGNAWDLIQKLRLGCCMLLVESDWVLWHYDRLLPWQHYVPVKNDLSDLGEVLGWCLTHDDLARQIATNGREFALSLDYECEMKKAAAVVFNHIIGKP